MFANASDRSQSITDKVFMLLRHRGPLSAVQISIELFEEVRTVKTALDELKSERVVEPRPDRNSRSLPDEDRVAWGLARR